MSDETKPTDFTQKDTESDANLTNTESSSDYTESDANLTNTESSSDYIKEEKIITENKSTNNNLLRGMVIALAIATFFAGFTLGNNLDEPEITREDIRALEEKIENLNLPTSVPQPSQPAQAAGPSQPQIFRVSLDDDPFKGDPDAPVTIVEFSDFQCPFCARFYQQTLSQLEENYIDTGKVKFVYRDLPLDSLHPNARTTHIAAECADEQGRFWEYHDILFESQGQWNRLASEDLENSLKQYAQDLSLDGPSFETCLSSDEIADEVNKDALEARSYGSTGTPTFFIGTEKDGFTKLTGAQPYSSFQRAIDSLLG